MCESNPEWKRINKDDIRDLYKEPYSAKLEKRILEAEREKGLKFLEEGFCVIVDDTNFHPKHEEFWEDVAKEKGITFNVLLLTTPLQECIDRDKKRENPVGEKVIKRMYYQNRELLD